MKLNNISKIDGSSAVQKKNLTLSIHICYLTHDNNSLKTYF